MKTKLLAMICSILFIMGAGIITGLISNYADGNECIGDKYLGFNPSIKCIIVGDHPDWAVGEINGTWGIINPLKQKNELGTFTGYFANQFKYSFLNLNIESGCMQGLFYKDDENPSLVFFEDYFVIWRTNSFHSLMLLKWEINDNETDNSVPFVILGKNKSDGSTYCTIFLQGQENMYIDGWVLVYK